jgi:carboxylate-amine ligase
MRDPSLTIGIEEEYQIVDPDTGELHSYITQDLKEDHRVIREFEFKPRVGHSVIEIGTRICRTADEAALELIEIRKAVSNLAAENDLAIIAAGTNPIVNSGANEIGHSGQSNLGLKQDRLTLEQKRLTFSTHVHITIEDREFLIDAMNVARYLLPHVLCLSTSSPFWRGSDTGLKSYRSLYLRRFARTGIPRILSSWAEYTELVDTLVRTNSIADGRSIWWDIRPNWSYPTLEFRICDVCTRVQEAVCVAAIFQAIIAKLWKLRYDNMSFRVYPAEFIEENKWRAARFGLDGTLIDFGKQKEVPARDLIHELISWFIDDVVDDLGSRKEIDFAYEIMEHGTSSDRQLSTWTKSRDMNAVIKQLIQETNELEY